jgi:nitrile hydratase accessory protein
VTPSLPAPLPASLPDGIPRDAEGPVFREPWEAQVFALTVRLHEACCFTWTEWADALSAEIRAAREAGDPDLGDGYYRHWLRALEALLDRKGIVAPALLAERASGIAAATLRDHDHDHDHGHEHDHGHDHDHDHPG